MISRLNSLHRTSPDSPSFHQFVISFIELLLPVPGSQNLIVILVNLLPRTGPLQFSPTSFSLCISSCLCCLFFFFFFRLLSLSQITFSLFFFLSFSSKELLPAPRLCIQYSLARLYPSTHSSFRGQSPCAVIILLSQRRFFVLSMFLSYTHTPYSVFVFSLHLTLLHPILQCHNSPSLSLTHPKLL